MNMTDEEAIGSTILHWSIHSKYRDIPHQAVFQRDPEDKKWWVFEDDVCSRNYPTQGEAARAYLKYYGLLT